MTGGAVGTVAADETPEPDEADAPSLEIDTGADTDAQTFSEELDSDLRLMEWEYLDNREGFELVFEADSSTRITITEAVQFGEGTGSGRIYTNRLPAGVTEVFVPVERRGGNAAVTMTTRQSIAENRFSYVSTGEAEPDHPALDYNRVRAMVILTALGAAGLVFRGVKNRRESEERDYERLI